MSQETGIMKITEAHVHVCPPGTELVYPGISSCLTVTAVFADGTRVGAHLVRVDEEHPWDKVFHTWLTRTTNVLDETGTGPTGVVMAGATDFWPEEILEDIQGNIASHFGIQPTQPEHMEGNLHVRADGAVESVS